MCVVMARSFDLSNQAIVENDVVAVFSSPRRDSRVKLVKKVPAI